MTRRTILAVLVLLVGLLPALPPPAAEAREVNTRRPGVYMGRQIAWTMTADGADWLTRESREKEESAREMIRALGLESGQVVADVGSGNGYHALAMAPLVGPTGRVLCVDIQPEMLDLLAERAKKKGITNYDLILGEPTSPRLPRETVDLILLVDAYHEFTDPESMLRNMRRSLKPDGLLALVEYRAEDPEVPMKPDHKMTRQQIDKEMRANGFRLVRHYDALPWQHLVFYGKHADGRTTDAAGD
jgi:ubiquinone/menaquinone biosynthesis C-methylase UbiE